MDKKKSNIDFNKLNIEQINLSKKLSIKDSFTSIKYIAGLECSAFDGKILCVIAVFNNETNKLVEKQYVIFESKFPYIKDYLAYRYIPAIVETYSLLDIKPDLIIVSGEGINHIRGFGLSSHTSIALNIPTIGVDKEIGYGQIINNQMIYDKKIVGSVIVSKEHSNPIYISPGNLISVNTSYEIVKNLIFFPRKLPEPLLYAHKMGKEIRKKIISS